MWGTTEGLISTSYSLIQAPLLCCYQHTAMRVLYICPELHLRLISHVGEGQEADRDALIRRARSSGSRMIASILLCAESYSSHCIFYRPPRPLDPTEGWPYPLSVSCCPVLPVYNSCQGVRLHSSLNGSWLGLGYNLCFKINARFIKSNESPVNYREGIQQVSMNT